MLIVVAGLPGTGKTTLAARLARRRGAAHVRLDAIEAAMRRCGHTAAAIGPTGYVVAEGVAAGCLAVGTPVVADAVCPVPESRRSWHAVAAEAGSPIAVVELVLGDRGEHRRRVEGRTSDLDGLAVPTWQQVTDREYAPWEPERDGPRLRLDSAGALEATLDAVDDYVARAVLPG